MKANVEAAIAQKATSEQDLMKLPGVNAVDVGYKYVDGKKTDEIAIRVHVSKKKNVAEGETVPKEINGIKTDVIEGTYEAQSVARQLVQEVDAQADTVKYRPLQGGISIGPNRSVGGYVYAGTLGCFVRDNTNGKALMLSNFHVMCVDNSWHAGDVMDQPSRVDTGTAADAVGTINRAVLSAHVDGAVANLNTGIEEQTLKPDLKQLIPNEEALNPFDMMEYIFMQTKNTRKFQFVSASSAPCFSAYGKAFTKTIVNHYKTARYDTAIWNTERKPDGTFDRCLHTIEPAALCF